MILLSSGPRSDRSKGLRSCAIAFLFSLTLAGAAHAYAVPTEDAVPAMHLNSGEMQLAQAQPAAPSPAPVPAPAPAANPTSPAAAAPAPATTPPAQGAASDEPIGNVATLTGSASVVRNQNTLPLKLKDDIYLNDVVTTFADSTLGITFNDETTFNLTAKASIKIDDFIYEDGGKQNSALFDVTKGTVAFVASAVAKTGNMEITTPTATLGIRGTTGLVEVDGAGSGAHNIKLYPDPDGHVGTIDVADRSSGARLGTLNQGASGFTVRAGAGGRFTAAPLRISPQQAARDQGVVRQVHAAQAVGRQVVTEQRALRRANPNLNRNNQRNAPSQPGQGRPNQRQPGQGQPGQRQNNLQQRPGGPQQPASPNRTGQHGQPGQTGQTGAPNRAGENRQPGQGGAPSGQPAAPNRSTQQGQPQQPPGAQRPVNAPALHPGGAPNRAAAPPKRPPPPKKPPRERKR
jgi:hypothetical protein